MADELTLAQRTDAVVRYALATLPELPEPESAEPELVDLQPHPIKRGHRGPVPMACMPSTWRPRVWGEWDHRWFAAVSSLTRNGAEQCAGN